MVGATLSLAIVLWLASSYVEYKIVKSSPRLQKWFHGVPAIVISLVISVVLGTLLAPAAGVAVVLAAFLGLATNEFTYKLYSGIDGINERRRDVTTKVSSFKSSHPTIFREAVEGIKAGFKVITVVFLAIVWLIGLPVRVARWFSAARDRIHAGLRLGTSRS